MPPTILLTNDDGYQAAGLRALWRELDTEFETCVVAPAAQRSWGAKAMTYREPLTVTQELVDGKPVQVVHDGTPADCTNLGIYHLLPWRPDLVISGINNGANFTDSLTLSSGTVGAALEAALDGILGIATSLDLTPDTEAALRGEYHPAQLEIYAPAARAIRLFVHDWLARPNTSHIKLINLLLPTHLAASPEFVQCEPLSYVYGSVFEKRGDNYHNRARGFLESRANITANTDVALVRQGKIVFTCYSGKLERISL